MRKQNNDPLADIARFLVTIPRQRRRPSLARENISWNAISISALTFRDVTVRGAICARDAREYREIFILDNEHLY